MSYGLRPLWRDFAVQQQVIGGIMMREMMTRWGRRNLGFAWLFCAPLSSQAMRARAPTHFLVHSRNS
jgi:ABC-type polysaccharide/polyol phosphate export permease